jgi:hypothetical protein
VSVDELPTDGWARVRKRPVVVEARRATSRERIHTREGTVVADPGDVILRGVEDEIYPCDPGIFAETYEVIEA